MMLFPPPHINILIASVFPFVAAQSSGVIEAVFLSFTDAPHFNKYFITSVFPLTAARWRAEFPS